MCLEIVVEVEGSFAIPGRKGISEYLIGNLG